MVKNVEDIRSGIIVTVFSTASAVGKTLLSINLAAELANQSYKVCVVDLDLQFGDVCNYLHIVPEKTIYDCQKAAATDEAMIVHDYISTYKADQVELDVLASPLQIDEAYNISTPAIVAVLSKLRQNYDYIVLDTTAAFSDLNLAVMDLSTIITFVGIVDFIPTIKNMKVGYDTMRSIGYEQNKIRFVLNRSNSKTHIELQDVEQLLEERFYHVLPNDFATAIDSVHTGIPLVISSKHTVLSRSLQELVAKYTNRMQTGKENKGSLSNWFKQIFS